MQVHKNYLIAFLLILCLTGISSECAASSSKGYIITLDHDTVFGRIVIPWRSTSIDFFNLIGFDFESFFYHVSFKRDSEKSYKTYYPTGIDGFGFKHRSTYYIFKSFYLNYKSIFEDKGQGYRFINLIHQGKLDLYQHMISINYPVATTPFADRGQVMKYYEYYIWSESTKLLWVGPKEHYRNLVELLVTCHVEDEYIRRIPQKATFKDIKSVLANYDHWLANRSSTF
jgi:hypothetical protein